jgi:hypothetical protein
MADAGGGVEERGERERERSAAKGKSFFPFFVFNFFFDVVVDFSFLFFLSSLSSLFCSITHATAKKTKKRERFSENHHITKQGAE